jgi:hypothetical protein
LSSITADDGTAITEDSVQSALVWTGAGKLDDSRITRGRVIAGIDETVGTVYHPCSLCPMLVLFDQCSWVQLQCRCCVAGSWMSWKQCQACSEPMLINVTAEFALKRETRFAIHALLEARSVLVLPAHASSSIVLGARCRCTSIVLHDISLAKPWLGWNAVC